MTRLNPQQAALIRANALLSSEQRIAAYRESLAIFESWVAWLEGKLRSLGVDPTDMEIA